MSTTADPPREQRLGRLKYGNPPANPLTLPRCGAKTRSGGACKRAARPNGRCRLHGGLSTGAKTEAGREAIRRAITKHGRFTAAAIAERRYMRLLLAQC